MRNAHLANLSNGDKKGTSGPLNAELIAELNERVAIMMDEIAALDDQKIVLSTELDKVAKSLAQKTNDYEILRKDYEQLQKGAGSLQNRATQAEKDRDEAASHALSCSEALGKAETEIESLADQLQVWKQKCKESDEIIQELKKQIKLLSARGDEESTSIFHRVKLAEDRVRELHSQLFLKSQELDSANDIIRKLRNDYQNTRQDAEGMLQVMTGLEKQLNEYADREAEIEKLGKQSKERMEEALTMKEQVIMNESNIIQVYCYYF